MKKLFYSILIALVCVALFLGCTKVVSGSEIHISSTGMPKTTTKSFVSNAESIYFQGNISAIGTVKLEVLSLDEKILYSETYEDVSQHKFSVELNNLTADHTYILVLNGTDAVSFDLTLTTDQKLSADLERPSRPDSDPPQASSGN